MRNSQDSLTLIELDDIVSADGLAKTLDSEGAILVRDLDLTVEEFEDISRGICFFFHHPGSRYQLQNNSGDQQTTSAPAGVQGRLWHSEGHYYPYIEPLDTCLFYCAADLAPGSAGTTLVDGQLLYDTLPKKITDNFEKNGIVYEMEWEPARWSAAFGTTSKIELKDRLSQLAPTNFKIKDNGALFLRFATQAINLKNGKPCFTNGILGHLDAIPPHAKFNKQNTNTRPNNRVFFGDGELLADQVILDLIFYCENLSLEHHWRKGDLLLIDNNRYMHGRGLSSVNAPRSIYTRFGWRDMDAALKASTINALNPILRRNCN